MSEYIVIPKDMLQGWDMLSDGELGSVVRTLIRYETTEATKVFTEKHVRAFYCSLVAVQRMYEQMEEHQQERQATSEKRRKAALSRWEKRDANDAMHICKCMHANAYANASCNASEKNHAAAKPAPIVEQEELRLESPAPKNAENAEKLSNTKRESKEKNQKKTKGKEIVSTPIRNLSLKETEESKEKKEIIKKEEKEKPPGANGIARGKKLAAKDIAMLYPTEKAAWQEWSKIYPAHRRAPAGPEIMEFVRLKGLVARKAEIFQTILSFQQGDADWKNGYIPRMTKFFKEERYENPPTPDRVVRRKEEVITHYIRQFKPEEEETPFNPNLFANDKPEEQHG